jgi:hypothetical protein
MRILLIRLRPVGTAAANATSNRDATARIRRRQRPGYPQTARCGSLAKGRSVTRAAPAAKVSNATGALPLSLRDRRAGVPMRGRCAADAGVANLRLQHPVKRNR